MPTPPAPGAPPGSGQSDGTRAVAPDAAVALGVVALGVFTLVGATTITVPLSSNVVGPRVFPYAVGVALLLSGLAVLVDALRGRLGDPESGEDVDADASPDWPALARIVLAFALHVAIVDLVGWALAGAALFMLVAWSLGARPLRAGIAGLVLGFTVQALFVTALGVTLPAGLFEGVLLLDG